MLRVVTEINEINECQKLLNNILSKNLSSKDEFTIGFPGGSMSCLVQYNTDIWYSTYEEIESTPRFWNGFGLYSKLDKRKSNNISVEVNIPMDGVNKNIAGLFAIDDNNEVVLMHRGKIGGGRKGIGKKALISWYPESTKTIYDNSNEDQALVVGVIESSDFVDNLKIFIENMDLFRNIATSGEINEATYISNEELNKNISNKLQVNKPKKKKITSSYYERSNYIAEYAKRRANGKCQLCYKDAPFINKSGKPYLETHHIVWLSNGSHDSVENTVALCPNCHRKMHIIDSISDRNNLLESIAK